MIKFKIRNHNRLFVIMCFLISPLLNGCDDLLNGSKNCDEPKIYDETSQSCQYPKLTDPIPNPDLDIDPPGELAEAQDLTLVIHYIHPDAPTSVDVSEWSLFTWENQQCDSLASTDVSSGWNDQSKTPAGVDEFGPYWVLELDSLEGCVNTIIRRQDLSKAIDADLVISLEGFSDRTVSFIGFDAQVFDSRADAWASVPQGLGEHLMAAHWIDDTTLVWSKATGAEEIRLYASLDASLTLNDDGTLSGEYFAAPLEKVGEDGLSPDQASRFPHLQGQYVLSLTEGYKPQDFLSGQLYLVALSSEGYITDINKVQIPGVLDDLYVMDDNDADEERLGAIHYSGDLTEFKLWAPTAQSVKLLLFDQNKEALNNKTNDEENRELYLKKNKNTGVWSIKKKVAVGSYYQYEVKVYHYLTNKIETFIVTDPYSLSLSVNSEFSQVIDLSHSDLKPSGWDTMVQPSIEDTVIYEAHLRDFSIGSDVSVENQSKYLAFTEIDSLPMQHLLDLKNSGLSYFHLLPIFDIATVNESNDAQVNIDDTVGKLCELNSSSDLCDLHSADTTLRSLLVLCEMDSTCAEEIVDDIRSLDGFNWGYDPLHFGVPEGSYAVNPDGSSRILEFRTMVKSLHDLGLRVVMDVVYNHTHASGASESSILDKIVPGYYHRLDLETGTVLTSTCCANTATEHRMMAKLMLDTLNIWAKEYHIDGFRFDLMGVQPLALMEEAYTEVNKTSGREVLFYGEGWNLGDGVDQRFEPAQQLHLAGSGIASFSDRLRDAVRGGGPFDQGEGIRRRQGFSNGLYHAPNELSEQSDATRDELLHKADQIRVELTGNLKQFEFEDRFGNLVTGEDIDYNGQPSGYTDEPYEVVSYVSKHDNQTLWDNQQYKISTGTTPQDRVRMQVFAQSFPLLGQGVPFIHMGAELLRSKSFERDSFDSGDWYNRVDFSKLYNNFNVGLPRDDKDAANYSVIQQIIADVSAQVDGIDISDASELVLNWLKVRKETPSLHLGDSKAVLGSVEFLNTGLNQVPGLIHMSVDQPGKPAIRVVFNGTAGVQTLSLSEAGWRLHPVLEASDVYQRYFSVEFSDGEVSVSPWTTAVFVRE